MKLLYLVMAPNYCLILKRKCLNFNTMHQKLTVGVTFWYLTVQDMFDGLIVLELEKVACFLFIFLASFYRHCNFIFLPP